MNKILIVDDEPFSLKTFNEAIGRYLPDIDISNAQSGAEGIRKAIKKQPDTIVLDIIMPEMDGYEVCRRLKADNSTKHIPILLLTAADIDTQSRVKGLEAGADAFLTKLTNPIEIATQIKVMLRIKAAEDQLRAEKSHLDKLVEERSKALKTSEEKFRKSFILNQSIMESASKIVVFALDHQYRYLAFTQSHQQTMKKIWGVDIEVGMNMLELISDKKDRLKAKTNFDRALKGESFMLTEAYGNNLLYRTSYDNYYNPVYDESKKQIIGLSVYTVDVTQRKLAEKESALKDRKYKELFSSMGDAVFVTQLGGKNAGRILEVNEAAESQTGYTREELLRKNLLDDIVSVRTKLDSTEKLEQRLRKGETITVVEKKRRKDGSQYWVEVTLAPYSFAGEDAVIGINRDINQRILMEKKATMLSRAVDQSPVSILITDRDGNIEYVNPKCSEITGYSVKEMLGKNPRIFQSGKHSQAFYKELWDTVLSGNNWEGEFYNKKKNGELYWEKALISPVIENKQIVSIIGIKEDITQKKQLLEELIQTKEKAILNEKRYNELFQNMRNGCAVYQAVDNGNDFVFVNFNKAAEHLEQVKKEDLIGKKVTEVFPGVKDFGLFDVFVRVNKTGKPEYFPISFYKDYRLEGWRENYVYKLPNGDLVAIYEDKTKEKSAEIELNEKNKALVKALGKAEESDRLKSAFLLNLSHEIRTPMNGILGFLELLNDPDLSSNQKHEYINIINISGQRLLNTVNDIIEISKIESGIVKLNYSEIQVNQLLNHLLLSFQEQARFKGLDFSYVSPKANIFLKTDEEKLTLILSKIISNAIKFTDEGHVWFGIKFNSKSITFYVKDSGVGIKPERKEAIFDRFVQEDITITRPYEGAGVGLSIAKEYTEKLGGQIRVESTPGEGSTFYVSFENVSLQINELPLPYPADEAAVFSDQNLILIVEDDLFSFQCLAVLLKKEKLKYIHAANGKEAVDLCEQYPEISLVLMDIKMPVMNGYEATREILKFRPNLPIVAQTAHAYTDNKYEALSNGCIDYLPKPISRDQLLRVLNKYLKRA
jgi:PAS domain S-box-containing protein